MVVSGIEDTQPQILSRRGMTVIVLGLVAYLEWFGLHGDWRRWQGECEEDEEEEEAAVTEQRGEKVKSTMKLDGPERRESTSTRPPLLARIAWRFILNLNLSGITRRKKRSIKNINIYIKS